MAPSLFLLDGAEFALLHAGAALEALGRVDGVRIAHRTADGICRADSCTQRAALALIGIDAILQQRFADAGRALLIHDMRDIFVAEIAQRGEDGVGSSLPQRAQRTGLNVCSQLFQAVNRANNFKDLKIFYFHNCWYSELYTGPRCVYGESVQTQWVINNLSRDYKVIVVGDASMAPSELTWVGGSSYYNRYNAETGLTWLNRFHSRFEKMVWFNPIPEAMWEYDYGYQTIEMIRNTVDMYQLTVEGLGRGLKKLVSAR